MLENTNLTEAIQNSQQQNSSISCSQATQNQSKNPQKSIKNEKNSRQNFWTPKEQAAYLNFLKEQMPMIMKPEYRKKQRIFKKISKLLQTRTPIQVKSHHQKLDDKYKSFPRIIAHLQRVLKESNYEQKSQCKVPVTIIQSSGVTAKDAFVQTTRQIEQWCYSSNYMKDYNDYNFIQDEDSLFI